MLILLLMRSSTILKITIAIYLMAPTAWAQAGKTAARPETKVSKVLGGQLSTILSFGMFGGALGLSTLSFYGRPQDKLSHVPAGMALGIITGVIFSTEQAVTEPGSLTSQIERESIAPEPLAPLAFRWTIDF